MWKPELKKEYKKVRKQYDELYEETYFSDGEIEEIKRRKKLTEFIILERAKKQIALENEKKKLALTKDII